MKKQITAMLMAVLMLASALPAYASSSSPSALSVSEDVLLMQELLSELDIPTEFDGEYVTRGEFLVAVMALASFKGDFAEESFYEDVDAASMLGFAAYHANKIKVISPSDKFNPDTGITVNEALKLMCAVLGYGELAEIRGGYPYGYISVASGLDLTDGTYISGGDYVSVQDFYTLIYNFVSVPVYQIYRLTYADGSYVSEYDDGGTILECYHDIYQLEGILTSNSVSDLYDEDIPISDSSLTVGSVNISGSCTGFLGMNVRAFYKDGGSRNELVVIAPYANEVKTLYSSDEPVFSGGSVTVTTNDGKDKTYKYDETVAVIYNGKSDKSLSPADIEITDGYAELVDNNDDSRYDCIKVWEKKYLVVDKTDIVDRMIYDANADNVIDMSDAEARYFLYNIESIDDILLGSCLEYTVSKDGLFYTIALAADTLHGRVEGTNTSNSTLIIDGNEYRYTDYYAAHYLVNTKPNSEITAVLSSDGKLIANTTEKVREYTFAYLFEAAKTGSGINLADQIKVFSEDSEMLVLTLKDTVSFNGSKITSDAAVKLLSSEQIIRYSLNSDGLVTAINTQTGEDGIFDSGVDDKNLLKRYWYLPEGSAKTVYYAKTGFASTYFMVNSSSKLFRVYPKEIQPDDSKRVQLASVSNLVLANPVIASSDFEAYNVDEKGYAQAVVYRVASDAAIYARASWGIVSSATYALDKEKNTVIKLELYNDDSFKFMYIANDNAYADINTDNKMPFAPGDLIRYETLDGITIDKYKKDFEADTGKLNHTASNDYANLNYYYGTIDASYSNSISFRITDTDGNERRVFYPVSLSEYCFVSVTGDVQTYPYSKLAGLLQNGGREYKILLRCSETAATQIVIYETE